MRTWVAAAVVVAAASGGWSVAPAIGRPSSKPAPSPRADLALELSVADPTPVVRAGQDVTVNIAVVSAGPDGSTGVALAIPVPDGMVFRSSGRDCWNDSGVIRCWVGGVSPDWSYWNQFVLGTRDPGPVTLSGSIVASDVPDPQPANDSASVAIELLDSDWVDLAVARVAGAGTPTAVAPYGAVLSVDNRGRKPASGVVLEVAWSGLGGVAVSQGSCTSKGSTALCSLGRMEAGGTVKVVVTGATAVVPGRYPRHEYGGLVATATSSEPELRSVDNRGGMTFSHSSPALPLPTIPTIPCRVVVVNRCLKM